MPIHIDIESAYVLPPAHCTWGKHHSALKYPLYLVNLMRVPMRAYITPQNNTGSSVYVRACAGV